MPISGSGWELHLVRLGQHRSAGKERTYGRYQVYRDGVAVPSLAGFICECVGPGDNSRPATPERKRRVEQGRYRLHTHFGKYVSSGYSTTATTPDVNHPLPGIGLEDRGRRSSVLIHPGHPPDLYLSSIGCLNPTSELDRDARMSIDDSRRRVIAIIDDLKSWDAAAFEHRAEHPLRDASILIEGEPANWL